MFNCWWPHGLQHARILCPPLSPGGVWSNPYPLSQWCYLNISSSVAPLAYAINFSQHQGLFQWVSSLYQLAKFTFSISPSNEYSGLIFFRIEWFDLLVSKGLSRVFSSITVRKHQLFGTQPSLRSNSQHPYMTTRKTIALTIWTFVSKVISLLFNILSRFVIARSHS